MKRNIINIVTIIIIFVLSCLCVNADEELPKSMRYKIENNEVTISLDVSENIIIPDYIEGYPVTKIGRHAFVFLLSQFNYSDTIYKNIIRLPETLVTIEEEAFFFYLEDNSREVTIPKNVQNIGVRAFGYYGGTIVGGGGVVSFYINKMNDFVIKGYKGTAAETYAKENGFIFVALDDEPDTTTATTSASQTTTTSTTVSTTSTSKATTETTKATTSTTLTTTTSATTLTTNSTTTISTSASTSVSSTSDSTAMTTSQTTAATTTITTTINVKGDANGDNKLDVRDAACIAKKLALDKAKELPKWADFNEDGTVNVRDAAAIARYLASNVKK